MKLLSNKASATEVVAHDVAPLLVNTDPRIYARLGWLIVLLGVGGFFVWAYFAPLDRGVPLSGTVTVAGNRKAVQHLVGGTVEDILVKEGDVVKAGQVLVRMNSVQTRAQLEISRVQYFSARATEARLLAERDGASKIAFPVKLEAYRNDPRVISNVAAQAQLFSSRQSAQQNELGSIEENILGLKSQISGLQESRESQKLQLKIIEEQLLGLRDLAAKGYVARNRVLDIERTSAQISGSLAEGTGNIIRLQRQVSEITMHRIQRQQEYQKEVRSQLSDVQKEGDALENRLTGQDFDLANADVKAPADGTIVAMNIFTHGGVVPSGFRLMDIVPSDDPLVVEGMLAVNLIDKVHPGLKVDLIFSAFNQNKTPHIPGVITQISADRFTDERSGAPYYKIKAQVAPAGVKLLTHLDVRPGMPVDMFIKTGERTMMSYLLKPVFDRAKTSMTEE